jgi:hypothetical protein
MGVLYIWEIYVLRSSLPMNVYEIYMGILIFENGFVVLEIFDFGTVRYGPNLPPYILPEKGPPSDSYILKVDKGGHC